MKDFVDGKLILSVVVSIVVTVVALDFYGYLRHSAAEDKIYITEFSLVAAEPGTDQFLSHKEASHSVSCQDGFAIMTAVKQGPGGLLVDKKRRPVRCQ